ncbi:MAG: transcription antitermination factor NusB [Pseudobacteriovorax sp.]|nr:transcription antitermination factor NusB [Pseudobacteriovorax sp.]
MELGVKTKDEKRVHPNSLARDCSLQFLYQCEVEKLFHFSEGHFSFFVNSFDVSLEVVGLMRKFISGVFDALPQLNETIEQHSRNWSLVRMPTTDRCVLRVATYELLHTDAPTKVVINEAIELAKKYGTADSGSFVNAVLDKVSRHSLPVEGAKQQDLAANSL